MHLAGLGQRHGMNKAAGIPAQWQQFYPYMGNIEGTIPGVAYGVIGEMAESCDDFEYLVAVEVREGSDVQPELKQITIPALTWARFTHDGDVTTIRSTIGAASEWLARSNRDLSDVPFSFFEYYGPQFDPIAGRGSIEIWFALKD